MPLFSIDTEGPASRLGITVQEEQNSTVSFALRATDIATPEKKTDSKFNA